MRIAYLVTLPLIVIGIVLFFVVTEINKAIERSMGKLGAFNELRHGEDSAVVFSILNKNLIDNRSLLDLNWTNAQVDVQLCKQIMAKMISDALQNKQDDFLTNSNKYEKGHCAE